MVKNNHYERWGGYVNEQNCRNLGLGKLKNDYWEAFLSATCNCSPIAQYLPWTFHPRAFIQFLESENLLATDHAGTSVLSQEWLHMWKQTSHDVLDSIGIVQAGGRSSRHQSFGKNFIGETPWVLLDLTEVFPALKSAFLYALPQSSFCYFPCFMQQRITIWAKNAKNQFIYI